MASIVRLFTRELANMISIDGNSTGVVVKIKIFSGLARELVSELSC